MPDKCIIASVVLQFKKDYERSVNFQWYVTACFILKKLIERNLLKQHDKNVINRLLNNDDSSKELMKERKGLKTELKHLENKVEDLKKITKCLEAQVKLIVNAFKANEKEKDDLSKKLEDQKKYCNELESLKRCIVCLDKMKCVIMLPCKHLCVCEECAFSLEAFRGSLQCPLCKHNVNETMKVFM